MFIHSAAAFIALIAAQSEVNLDSLFHGLAPDAKLTEFTTTTLAPSLPNSDVFDNYMPYANSRHDEFDWSLTKNVLNTRKENTILSPFLVKLLLSILAEAAGTNTSTHRELQSVLPSVQTTNETRELYGKAFGSLLVS